VRQKSRALCTLLKVDLPQVKRDAFLWCRVDNSTAAPTAAGKGPFRLKTIPEGAATSVWAGGRSADEIGGQYCENCRVGQLVPDDVDFSEGVRGYALAPNNAEALWKRSEEMVGESF
jgi:hypothetical protein